MSDELTGPELDEALLRCATEPIHVPGSIQPHGVLLAAAARTLRIVLVSANAEGLLGRSPELLIGRPLGEVVTLPSDDLTDPACDVTRYTPWPVTVDGVRLDGAFHRSDDLVVLELAPAGEELGRWYATTLPRALARLQAADRVEDFAAVVSSEIHALTGFDRVMLYRFDSEWNGEVIAEDRRADLDPFLGLHFPASDIPAQARALYTRNWLRLIPDVDYLAQPLLADPDAGPRPPLDMSDSRLRSVSPIHLQYLRNMGVAASMSVSLVVDGRLWGLVACHHYGGPHRPSFGVRIAAEFLARTAAALLPGVVGRSFYESALANAERAASLTLSLARPGRSLPEALADDDVTMLDLVPAGGAAAYLGGSLQLIGTTPTAEQTLALFASLWPDGDRHTVATDSLTRTSQVSDSAYVETASGVLAVPLAASVDAALVWFRPEQLREVTWGGDPTTPKVVATEAGPTLTPRRSFAAWSEVVRETATPWLPHEVASAERLARQVADALLERRAADDRVASALQRTLLGAGLPDIPGLTAAVTYLPSAADLVGADWFDLFPLPNGHVAAVVGDVAGHGLGMSAVTAELRHALRAYLLRELDPALALTRLNELVSWQLPGDLASAVVVDLDLVSGQARVASAGHPPAVLVGAGGSRLVEEVSGPALGLLESSEHTCATVELTGDDALVLYTDGLVERRHVDLDERIAELAAVAQGVVPTLGPDCDALVDAMGARGGQDDVTVLAIRLDPASGAVTPAT